jgi:hypothetical protein
MEGGPLSHLLERVAGSSLNARTMHCVLVR